MAVTAEWNYKEIADFYSRVRAVLNNLSNVSLTDEQIDFPEKAPFAEMYIKSKVPNWMELSEVDFALFETAIVYKTASFFQSLLSANAIKRKELPTLKIEFNSHKPIFVNGSSLDELVNEIIEKINGYDNDDYTRFVVTT